jgi:hypothetical protein
MPPPTGTSTSPGQPPSTKTGHDDSVVVSVVLHVLSWI